MDWQDNRCDCGGVATRQLFQALDLNFQRTKDVGEIRRCLACASILPSRFPTEATLGEAYGDYYTAGGAPQRKPGLLKRLLDRTRAAYLTRATPPDTRRLLDYGCGSGEFLATAQAAEKFGTDIKPAKGDFHWLAPASFRESPLAFDWITLGHVLEHLSDADTAMASLARCLEPGGGIWIATPNAEGFLFTAFGPYARDVDFPRHRQVYSQAALTALLQRHKLSPTYHRPPRINAALNCLACAKLTLANRQEGPRRVARVIFGGLLLLLHLVAPSRGRDPELLVVARLESR